MKRFSLGSLRVRLILLVLLAVIPALALTLYTGWEARQTSAATAQRDALQLAVLASANQDLLVESTQFLLNGLARLPEVRQGDPATCSALFANLLQQYPLYANLGVAKPNGDLWCSAVPASGPVSYTDRAWFQDVMRTRDFAIGGYVMGKVTRKPLASFGYPVLDATGQVQAVVFAGLDLDWLNRFVTQAELPAGSTLTVIDSNGTVLASNHEPDKWVGQTVSEAPIVEAILERQSQGTVESIGVDGVNRLYAFTPLSSNPQTGNVYVAIGIPTAVAYAQADQMSARNLATLGLVTVLALATAWVGGDFFLLRRINVLLSATKRLAAGDLGARTGISYGAGELSQLARTFDQMAQSLEQREAGRKRAEETLRESEQRYQLLFGEMLDGFALHEIICDEAGKPCDYRFLAVNPAFERLMRLHAKTIVGNTVRQVIPGIESHCIDTYGEVALTGNPAHFDNYSRELDKYFDVTAFSPQKGQFATIFVDITERKQAVEALRASEAELRALFAAMTDVVIVYDADGRYIKIAPNNPVNLYRPPDDMLGKTVHDVLPKEQADYIVAKIDEAIQTSQVVTGEYALQIGGKEIWFASSASRLSENTVVWVAHDITNRKQAEEQIQRQVETLGSLYDLARTLSAMEDFNAILDMVTRRAVESTHVTFASVLLLEQDDLVVRAVFPVRMLDLDLQVGHHEPLAAHPFCQRVLEGNVPLVLQSDSPEAGECASFFLGIAQTLCIVPLHVREKSLGLLMLGEARDAAREPFTAEKVSLGRQHRRSGCQHTPPRPAA